MDTLRKQASKLREQVAKQQQLQVYTLILITIPLGCRQTKGYLVDKKGGGIGRNFQLKTKEISLSRLPFVFMLVPEEDFIVACHKWELAYSDPFLRFLQNF